MNVNVKVNSSREFVLPYADDGTVTPATKEVWREVCAEIAKQNGDGYLLVSACWNEAVMVCKYKLTRSAECQGSVLESIGREVAAL